MSENVEDMLKMWGDTDSLTLTGLHVLRKVIDKAIEERTAEGKEIYQELLPLPEHPSERPCWKCRTWIKLGQAIRYQDGKTYHSDTC